MSATPLFTLQSQPGQLLPLSFYDHLDVVQIAQDLLGKVIVSQIDRLYTSGLITETEAYRAPDDRACHAYQNRRTPRTETMFGPPGTAYVYLCYGIHELFNVITGPKDTAHAVLIRAVQPIDGVDIMLERRGMAKIEKRLTSGPGTLSQALGITRAQNAMDLNHKNQILWIEDRGYRLSEEDIVASKRVGIDSAGQEAVNRPWRFYQRGTLWVSKK